MLKWLFGNKKASPKLPSNFRDLLDIDAVEIVEKLQQSGYETYLVGGCVRDILLKKKPKDFDIATSASPQKVKSLINRSFIIGKRFRIVLAKRNPKESKDPDNLFPIFRKDLPDKEFQITTFRRDPIEIDGKINENVFGTAKEDAYRRDFSLNALFLDPVKGEIVDFVNGLSDLSKGKLVVIGDPEKRFVEDPIRMLRAIRFMARADLDLDPKAEKALLKHFSELKNSKKERIREEVLKILREGHATRVFKHLKKMSAWDSISSALSKHFSNAKTWETTLDLVGALAKQKWSHPSQSPFLYVAFYPLIDHLFETRQNLSQHPIFEDLKVSKAEIEDILKIRFNIKRLFKDIEAKNPSRVFYGSGPRHYISWAQTFFVLHTLQQVFPNKYSKLVKNWNSSWKDFIQVQTQEHKSQWYAQKNRSSRNRRPRPHRSGPSTSSASVKPAPFGESASSSRSGSLPSDLPSPRVRRGSGDTGN
jgi:poly(A) polymerase